jgi:antitoxin HicB
MRIYRYPAEFTPAEEGGFVITFPDVPEAITQADTLTQALEHATDALDEAIVGRINTGEDIPSPSAQQAGQYVIPVPAQTALKAALYQEVRDQKRGEGQLATRLGIDENEMRCLLDPHHASKLPQIAEILERVGKHIVIQIGDEKDFRGLPF